MKAAGKKSRRRLGRLGKTVRNLSLSALLLGLLWFNSGFSAWTAGGALDRAERRQLLPPGTVQYQEMGDRNRVLVTGEGYAYTGIVQRTRLWYSASILELISLEGEPRLLTWGFSGMIDDRGQETLPVFCLDPPEGTARAEMTLTGDYVHTVGEYQGDVEQILERREETLTFHGQGEALDENLVRLDFTVEDEEQQDVLSGLLHGSGELGQITDGQSSHWVPQATRYQVDFYRADGGLIGSIQGDWDGGA
ncbi:hypothetical protein [Pseudoflavonifractor capillosus]|uniref:hypothetical protein n=1 Tax=Pseudoflavonifractor capillosus TaxID=106588 RepID=UPI00195ED105|nr:hypothetical protein [Pseudoflavonifractor capillosus]MBM6679267.1 hypothetical protein [Pseudoflavonifractor capillosus]